MVDRKIREIREICVEEITDPLYLPLKRGGPVCPPLESPMISNGPEERPVKSVGSVCYKIIIRERKNQSIIRINSADNKSNEPDGKIREIGGICVL